MVALKRHIEREGLSQNEAAKVFGVTQPRISNLMRGKIEVFGLDMLVNLLSAAGLPPAVGQTRFAHGVRGFPAPQLRGLWAPGVRLGKSGIL